jgi:hypothetical protein
MKTNYKNATVVWAFIITCAYLMVTVAIFLSGNSPTMGYTLLDVVGGVLISLVIFALCGLLIASYGVFILWLWDYGKWYTRCVCLLLGLAGCGFIPFAVRWVSYYLIASFDWNVTIVENADSLQ